MHFDEGTYTCRGCDAPLFTSDSKFDSHCGWPSFDQGIAKGAILEKLDKTHGMIRTEIVCASCGGHLGHVFNDGPTATGLRYCVNSLSIDFKEEKEEKGEQISQRQRVKRQRNAGTTPPWKKITPIPTFHQNPVAEIE